MEGIVLLKSLVQQRDWMVSIDLKDAYLSVMVAEEHRKHLRFQWEDQLYEFLCLPFSLSSVPRTFTKSMHFYEAAQTSDVINKTARNRLQKIKN